MPSIHEEIVLDYPKESVFKQISSIDFMLAIDPNFGRSTVVLFHDDRLMRTRSTIEKIGDVEIERITIPETYTIVTQRRQPMAPFIYQISIQILLDHDKGTLLKWNDEFELDVDNKHKEEAILGILRRNDVANLQNIQRLMK
jgi:hypothetical protein